MRSSSAPLACFLFLSLTRCGGVPPVHPSLPPPKVQKPEVAPTPQERLRIALLALPPVANLLEGLAPPLRQDLEAVLSRLPAQERMELAGPKGVTHPLFHVAEGGTDPEALFRLATGAAPEQLFSARSLQGSADLAPLVPAVSRLVHNTGLAWLHGTARRLSAKETLSPDLCDRIDQVALALGRPELRVLAREVAADLEPTPFRQLALSRGYAEALKPSLARTVLAHLTPLPGPASAKPADSASAPEASASKEKLQRARAEAERMISVAERAQSQGTRPDLAASIEQARALLDLGQVSEAHTALTRYLPSQGKHLGLSVVNALATLDNSTCPGIPESSQGLLLCSWAWQEADRTNPFRRDLEQSWQSGLGRSEAAVEDYLGLAHVTPWVTSIQLGTEPATGHRDRLAHLLKDLKEVTPQYPRYSGLVLFTEALHAGISAALDRTQDHRTQERSQIPAPEADRLVAEAVRLGTADQGGHFAVAGVLGVAGIGLLDRDPFPLFALLPDKLEPGAARAAGWLQVWNGLAHARPELVSRGRAALLHDVSQDPSADTDPAPHAASLSRTILALAEADYALKGDPTSLEQLSQISERLRTAQVGPLLAWRAALDRAGAAARRGEPLHAVTVLEEVTNLPLPTSGAPGFELAWMARVYRLVLQNRAGTLASRDASTQLRQWLKDLPKGSLPSALQVWTEGWYHLLSKGTPCGATPDCPAAPPASPAELGRKVGSELALILLRGVLPLGAVSLHFNYSPRSGLAPIVEVDPSFIAVEIPPFFPGQAQPPQARSKRP